MRGEEKRREGKETKQMAEGRRRRGKKYSINKRDQTFKQDSAQRRGNKEGKEGREGADKRR